MHVKENKNLTYFFTYFKFNRLKSGTMGNFFPIKKLKIIINIFKQKFDQIFFASSNFKLEEGNLSRFQQIKLN